MRRSLWELTDAIRFVSTLDVAASSKLLRSVAWHRRDRRRMRGIGLGIARRLTMAWHDAVLKSSRKASPT